MGFGTRTIRQVVQYCQDELKMAYPLATQEFKTDRRTMHAVHGCCGSASGQQGAQAWDKDPGPFLKTSNTITSLRDGGIRWAKTNRS